MLHEIWPSRHPTHSGWSKMTYNEYMASPEWRQLRAQAIARDGGSCRLCNSSRRLQAHHRHYPPYGAWHLDKIENLTTLCAWCHERVHHQRQRQQQQAHGHSGPWQILLVTLAAIVALLAASIEWRPIMQSLTALFR